MRDYNADIMPKFRTLAAYIHSRSGNDLPNSNWAADDLFQGDELWGEVEMTDLLPQNPDTPVVN